MKSIAVNSRILAPVESSNTDPVEFYARGRVGLYDAPAAGHVMDI